MTVYLDGAYKERAECIYETLDAKEGGDWGLDIRLIPLDARQMVRITGASRSAFSSIEATIWEIEVSQQSKDVSRVDVRGHETIYGNNLYEHRVLADIQSCGMTRATVTAAGS